MINSIEIESLFERYDYKLNFNSKKMVIISGPNGYGKTTILNVIRDILDDDLFHLSSIIFKKITIETDDRVKLVIEKNESGFFINSFKLYVPATINSDDRKNILFVLKSEDINELRIKHKKYFIPQQVLNERYLSIKGLDAYTDDVLLRINVQLLGQPAMKVVEDVLRFYTKIGNSIYCSADRLYHYYPINGGGQRKNSAYTEVINTLPERMSELFGYYNSRYTQMSNNLDFTFVSQLNYEIKNSSIDENDYSEEDYNSDIMLISNRLDRLASFGFLSRDELTKTIEFNSQYSVVFKIFANNYLQKLDVLEKLADKLSLFKKIIDSKLTNKEIIIKNDKRIDNIIQVKDRNIVIPLANLSSGEKEIIVMYYNLIFESNYNLIALVDEPELSSHISWQYEALDDFEKIMEVNNSLRQMIICTHSPQIINNRWDEVIDLCEQAEKNKND